MLRLEKLIQIIIFILNTLRGCSMRIQNVSEIAQCAFKIWQELLYFLI
jgi:hypothetical protein